jgi:hypothetical protein
MIQVLSETKNYLGQYFIKIYVKFPTKEYIEEYKAYPRVVDKFKWMLTKKWGYKSYHFLKKYGELQK